MPRVATFCPRCGEAIDTELPEEAKSVGRAELACPACRFRFVIAPAAPTQEQTPPTGDLPDGPQGTPEGGPKNPDIAEAGDSNEDPPAKEAAPESGAPAEPDRPAAAGIPQATQVHATKRSPSGSLPARLLSAGLLLFFAAALGLFYAIVFANAPGIFQEALEGPEGSAEVDGSVVDSGRDRIEGARVSVLAVEQGERPDLETPEVANATTDGEGRYRVEGVDPGVRWLKIESPGYRTTFFETWALTTEDESPGQPNLGSALWEVSLQEGEQDDVVYQTQQVSLLEGILKVFQVSGWIAFPASVLCAVAGVFILMRRSFGWCVTGAVAGILAVGFLVGAVMALVALILVLTARREFTPFKKPKERPDAWDDL